MKTLIEKTEIIGLVVRSDSADKGAQEATEIATVTHRAHKNIPSHKHFRTCESAPKGTNETLRKLGVVNDYPARLYV